MVYNAMKLFMEINPQLFDDCSHDYTEMQNSAEQRQADRQMKWDKLADQARKMSGSKTGSVPVPMPTTAIRPKVSAPSRIDEADPATQDSQRRLDALKLQDETSVSRNQGFQSYPD